MPTLLRHLVGESVMPVVPVLWVVDVVSARELKLDFPLLEPLFKGLARRAGPHGHRDDYDAGIARQV